MMIDCILGAVALISCFGWVYASAELHFERMRRQMLLSDLNEGETF